MSSRRAGWIARALAAAMLVPAWASAAVPTPPTPAPTGSSRFTCDHPCLARHADAYFSALAAHDPSRLPLS